MTRVVDAKVDTCGVKSRLQRKAEEERSEDPKEDLDH
jgi:hypothetical protein